jgi:hypothetical protein
MWNAQSHQIWQKSRAVAFNLASDSQRSDKCAASTLLDSAPWAAKDFLIAAKAQEGILITYPTANELDASTMAYASAKKRYLSEFRSAMPILIAIGLKQRPETAEIEEFRSAFRVLDGEEEQWVAKATAEMLKRFDNDQAVAAAEKEFVQAQEIERGHLVHRLYGLL